jgi:TonB family protein
MLKVLSMVLYALTAVCGPAMALSEEGVGNLPLRYEHLDLGKDTWGDRLWAFQGKVAVGLNDKAERPRIAKGFIPTQPKYSEVARLKKVNGIVQVALWIDAQGKVVDAAVTQPLEHSLDRNAFESIRRWKFAPASLNGTPMPSLMLLEATFRTQ